MMIVMMIKQLMLMIKIMKVMIMMKETASVADNGDDDAAVMDDRNFIDETAPDDQKYDDQLTKDAHGDCNDEVAKNNQKKDVQGDDKEDDHISRCVEPFIVNVQLINNLYV
jgi:hypothetical protein